MSLNRIFALATRIIRQFFRDKRTLALIFIVPILVMGLLAYLITSPSESLRIGVSISEEIPFREQLLQKMESYGLEVKLIEPSQAFSLIQSEELQGALIFPEDLLNFKSGAPLRIRLLLEGSEPSISSQILEKLSLFLREVSPSILGAAAFPELKPEFLYGGEGFDAVDYLAPAFVSFFVFFFVFLLSVVSFLRERAHGTMERLMASPLKRGEIIAGYALGFLIFALIQSAIILLFVIYVLGIQYRGSLWLVYLVNFFVILVAVSLGIFLSAFARNELQAIQFIPIVVVPQALLGGFFWPVEQLVLFLRVFSYCMPMTYATWALKDVMVKGQGFGEIWPYILILLAFTIFFFFLASISVKRSAE